MQPLDQRADFRDDGGTPAWRANQATLQANPVTRPPRGRPLFTLREWVLAMFGLAILPFVLIAFGFCAIIVWICLQDVLGTTWAIFALAIVAWTFLAAVRNSLRR